MGEDFEWLRMLSARSQGGGPAAAVALQALAASFMEITVTFETLRTYIGFTLSLCAGLTAIGVFVLRRREPGLERPYRVWGYPVTPALFAALSLWMAGHTMIRRPVAAAAGLGTLAIGVVIHLIVGRGRAR
jgi:APA family basic amino acid/polyamine antiporter